jgi:hypothetical protein
MKEFVIPKGSVIRISMSGSPCELLDEVRVRFNSDLLPIEILGTLIEEPEGEPVTSQPSPLLSPQAEPEAP